LIAALGAELLAGRSAAGQSGVFRRFNIDRLQLAALGASAGPIHISQANPTTVYGLGADYGEIAPEWRVFFGVSFWQSHYTDAIVRTFADSLTNRITGASGSARIEPSPISLYDVTFSMEFRWMHAYSGEVKPFLGIGLAGHVINAEGPLINGTFIERSLDNIAAGLIGSAGAQLRLLRHFGIEASARGDMLSGFRSVQLRAGGNYVFGHVRGTRP
jgi:hypothetical protein